MKKYTLKPLPGESLQLVHPQRFTVNYKSDLNEAQYAAVSSVNGPHLVIDRRRDGKDADHRLPRLVSRRAWRQT